MTAKALDEARAADGHLTLVVGGDPDFSIGRGPAAPCNRVTFARHGEPIQAQPHTRNAERETRRAIGDRACDIARKFGIHDDGIGPVRVPETLSSCACAREPTPTAPTTSRLVTRIRVFISFASLGLWFAGRGVYQFLISWSTSAIRELLAHQPPLNSK